MTIEPNLITAPVGFAEHITFEDARSKVLEMNLINGFLFDSVMSTEENAETVARVILERVLRKKLSSISVTPQKTITGIDTDKHGIRLDVQITQSGPEGYSATVYDIEMEDRVADRKDLPRRRRYYVGLSDSKLLESGIDYSNLPEYISITILSYDPFELGDMYYEGRMKLVTHPEYDYDDGILNIFLYAYGNMNHPDKAYGKKLQELLKYIVTGDESESTDEEIHELNRIVSEVKLRSEVTKDYMKQWDRELSLKREATLAAKKEDAVKVIRFGREDGASDDKISYRLKTEFGFDSSEIDELFRQADEELVAQK